VWGDRQVERKMGVEKLSAEKKRTKKTPTKKKAVHDIVSHDAEGVGVVQMTQGENGQSDRKGRAKE